MRHLRRFLTVVATVLTVASLGQAPAMAASESGTHAWSTDPLTLRKGPGSVYEVTGQIAADQPIKVLRCQERWCIVDGDGGRGWTNISKISFGKTSADWPGGINPNYPSGGGTVCFYQGTNYTGQSMCFNSGSVVRDLALAGADNAFSSVQITGNATVAVCRDRDFQSYCERVIASKPVLSQYLRRNVSSIRVY